MRTLDLDIEIYLTSKYYDCGVFITGRLLVVKYSDALHRYRQKLPLNGYNSGSTFDYIDQIRSFIHASNIKGKEELTIPDYVLKLD